MYVTLSINTHHGSQRSDYRDVPIHQVSAVLRKYKHSLCPGRSFDKAECDVRIGGICYHCVLHILKKQGERLFARLITVYPV